MDKQKWPEEWVLPRDRQGWRGKGVPRLWRMRQIHRKPGNQIEPRLSTVGWCGWCSLLQSCRKQALSIFESYLNSWIQQGEKSLREVLSIYRGCEIETMHGASLPKASKTRKQKKKIKNELNHKQTRAINYIIHDIYIKSIIILQHFDIRKVASHYRCQFTIILE